MLKKGGVLVSSTLLVRPHLCSHSFPRLIQVQVTGILGTKAYRCLSNAGFVIVTLSLMRAAIIAVSGVVLAEYKGGRRFTGEQCPQSMSTSVLRPLGTCETISESPLLPLSIILQFLEACFICICCGSSSAQSVHNGLTLPSLVGRLQVIPQPCGSCEVVTSFGG